MPLLRRRIYFNQLSEFKSGTVGKNSFSEFRMTGPETQQMNKNINLI